MNIGLSTAAFYGRWETEEAAEHLSDYGAACAEAFLQTWGEMTAGFAADVRKRLNGIPCTSMHPKGTLFENELFGRSPSNGRRDGMRFSTHWMRLPNWVRHITFITAGIHRQETKYRLMHSEMPMLSGRCS